MATFTVETRGGARIEVKGKDGASLMKLIRRAGVEELEAQCGGSCACATCHVYLTPPDGAKLGAVAGAGEHAGLARLMQAALLREQPRTGSHRSSAHGCDGSRPSDKIPCRTGPLLRWTGGCQELGQAMHGRGGRENDNGLRVGRGGAEEGLGGLAKLLTLTGG